MASAPGDLAMIMTPEQTALKARNQRAVAGYTPAF
jgi:hypothetical protein